MPARPLPPKFSNEINYRTRGLDDTPLPGWERIDATELNGKTMAFGQADIEKGYKRIIYRNNSEGRSVLELRDPKGNILSQEMIIARDPNDTTKGVVFFSYEDGRLSKTFKASLNGGHSSTGHGCMACHGALDKATGRIISSFSPKGTNRSLGAAEHPSTKGLEKANSRTIKEFPLKE